MQRISHFLIYNYLIDLERPSLLPGATNIMLYPFLEFTSRSRSGATNIVLYPFLEFTSCSRSGATNMYLLYSIVL